MEKPELIHKRFFSVKEAATYTGLSVTGIYRKLNNRNIRHYQVGGKKILDIKDLDAFILSSEVMTSDELREVLRKKLSGKKKSDRLAMGGDIAGQEDRKA